WLSIVAFRRGSIQRQEIGRVVTGLCRVLAGRSPATTRDSEVSVQRRFAGWPCLPAAMHPEPLIRITPDDVLNNTGELCRVGYDVSFVVSGANQLNRWIETQYVFAQFGIPHRKCRHHGG